MVVENVSGRGHEQVVVALSVRATTTLGFRTRRRSGVPDELGSFQTAHKRLIRWAVDGTWERILTAILASADAGDDVSWTVSVDATVCRAHQHAAGARKRGRPTGPSPDHAIGRSRGGLSTKVHLASDGRARPLALIVTAGQAGDAPAFEAVMARIRVPRGGFGRPRTRPAAVLADRAYSSRAIRGHLRRRGIRAVIPHPDDQIGHRLRRGRLGGGPPGFDADAYKQRNTVERCINRLKQWRGLAMRTDKLAIAYQAALHVAAILIWTRN
ncbi:IS5 family transposase [Streptomyces sp. NPDC059340]|uniref:IS5 family transposase n=1 Tax=Streptomyces sp. NPDC059340 TaxID=3346806 RepID=UPI0036868662